MFLRFLDDLEQQREQEAELGRKKFRPAIDPPYRWRDWAANPQGITGDELLAFINQDEVRRPDGKRGPGLFAYLRSLSSANGDNRRDVIATVFRGVDNRMKSGYLLRDVINKVADTRVGMQHQLAALGRGDRCGNRDLAAEPIKSPTLTPALRLLLRRNWTFSLRKRTDHALSGRQFSHATVAHHYQCARRY
jgi:hypothetical protein